MTDYTDLIARLKDPQRPLKFWGRDMAEAAAALDALEAENARLRDHVQDLIRVCEENDIHDMTLAAVAADLSLTHQ